MEWSPYMSVNYEARHEDLRPYLETLDREIFKVLDQEFKEIDIYFHPIYTAPSFEVIGFEALCRPRAKRSVLELLKLAKQRGCLSEFDLFCRIKALITAVDRGLKEDELIFLNVHPGVLDKKPYPQGITSGLISILGLKPGQVVLEITEFEKPEDTEIYLRTVFHFIRQGFKISLDDFGAGCIGYRNLLEIEPDFVKIDSYFVRSLYGDPIASKFIRHIQEVCIELGCEVIAEGVEDGESLSVLEKIGIKTFQGYYFSRPSPHLDRGGTSYVGDFREITRRRRETAIKGLPYF